MSNISTFNARLRDRLSLPWLTPSEAKVWEQILQFDAPPHRVINVYGVEGSGKTFLGWVMEQEKYASYSTWGENLAPTLTRLVIDDAPSDKTTSRTLRPMVEKLGIKQIILLTLARVDERAMPAFELKVDAQDLEHFGANLFRYMHLTIPEGAFRNYKSVVTILTR